MSADRDPGIRWWTSQNYLRGVQEADASGRVVFTTIFPGCYAGRWPHIHFEVYATLASAQSVANKLATSQLALPKTAATRSTPPRATSRASATCRRSRSPPT